MDIADSFFDDEGNCTFLKLMEEEGFTNGNYSCQDLQTKISNRNGKTVSVTFKKKGSDLLYPDEFSIFMDGRYNRIDHPNHDYGTATFNLDGHHPSSHSVKSILKSLFHLKFGVGF